MKIAVYTIALNESQFVERWLKSTEQADYRCVTDTGSTDDTVDKLFKGGVEVSQIFIKPFRFDDARNAALSHLPPDVDVCISLDMDEILTDDWLEIIENTWQPTTTRLKYGYKWNSEIEYQTDKIHARHSHRWKQPVHEHLVPTIPEVMSITPETLIIHKADNTKPRSQYLPLLKLATEEDPTDDRAAHYLARELFFHKHYHESIAEFKRHLQLSKAVWKAERAASMRYLGKIYAHLDDKGEAERYFTLAILEDQQSREALCDLARFVMLNGRFTYGYDLAQKVMALPIGHHYLNERYANVEGPFDLMSVAYFGMGNKKEALTFARKALDLNPTDERLIRNLQLLAGS